MNSLKKMTVCGLMSGTSLDGVDVAIVEFTPSLHGKIDYSLVYFNTIDYDEPLKEKLQDIVLPNSQSPAISSMNMLLGEVFADAVLETEIGRASCRERVWIEVGGGARQKEDE